MGGRLIYIHSCTLQYLETFPDFYHHDEGIVAARHGLKESTRSPKPSASDCRSARTALPACIVPISLPEGVLIVLQHVFLGRDIFRGPGATGTRTLDELLLIAIISLTRNSYMQGHMQRAIYCIAKAGCGMAVPFATFLRPSFLDCRELSYSLHLGVRYYSFIGMCYMLRSTQHS
jgi:hypothetical protein